MRAITAAPCGSGRSSDVVRSAHVVEGVPRGCLPVEKEERMKRGLVVLCVFAVSLILALPARAITDGELDGEGHPYVGLMVAQDAAGNPMWRCSGTLLSESLFMTAGHCTESPAPTSRSGSTPMSSPYPGERLPAHRGCRRHVLR